MKPKRMKAIPHFVTYDLAEFMAAVPKSGPKILVTDIETSMMIGYFFGTFKQNIAVDDIIQDWNILSFTAKWAHQPTVLYQSLREQRNPINDFALCKSLAAILNEADVVVAHNGKRFDLKKIRARMALNRMRPIQDNRIVDTLLESRKVFGYTSQKLVYLASKFGPDGVEKSNHGKFPGKKLWHECQQGNQEAWDEMEHYNVLDVITLEGVYLELRPWFQGAQNLAIFSDEPHDGHTCPNCGGTKLRKKGARHTQVGIYQRYVCECGAWSRGRTQIVSREDRRHVTMN